MTPTADDARQVNQQIADELRADIVAGRLKPGERLPAVRQIAERFQVAPGTATKALQTLAARGLVRADSTRGYYVTDESERPEAQVKRSPEFTAIMREIELLRAHLARLDDRLQQLENAEPRE
ncbi:GntR family transcriptional regulator [Streptomyces sp. NRRL B-1677]|uniref:GntR family transcriptional regulator n=1 Tax=Streptomyces TaxID=1883 RepID=UPI001892C6E9|nr:winged helix-turn-helix domain-containing protein [Streptomyces sp. NRRL B-1677]MBF6046390.1 GntR family transcriptional regulator [Streptomyces sp. NRRL B-1677]